MAKGEIVKPRELVKAQNELFRCKYKIKDVVACRIFMAFASLVDHKDVKENQSFVEYQIPASSIIQDIDAGGGYYKQLKDAAYSLIDQKIEQRFDKKNFVLYTLFSKIEYRDGIIKGEFHKDLVPFFIIARGKFTKLNLQEYMDLPSIYSQCIFGFLKSWNDKDEVIIKLSELHEILDIPQLFKKDFYEFKRRVLDKAHKDINERTSLHYEWEPIKNGRQVTEIKFTFIKNYEQIKLDTYNDNQQPQPEKKEQTNQNTINFEHFLKKFTYSKDNRYKAWKIWNDLRNDNIAPLDKDVPENNEQGIMEFLEEWKNTHMQNQA